jgi:cytochrome P450
MSFVPFLGGKRICIGKTFAEVAARLVGPSIFSQFDFDFVNPEDKIQKKPNNFTLQEEPSVTLKISLAK